MSSGSTKVTMPKTRTNAEPGGEAERIRKHFERMPKVELHLHLEGAIPLDALWTLVTKYGGDPDVPTVESLEARFQYRDFPHFLETWGWKNRFLREYEDFSFIAEAVAQDLASQNILYVEAFYSPTDHVRTGLDPQTITEALRKGLNAVPDLEVALIADLVRDHGPERGLRTLEAVREVSASCGVIGIGIGGSEHLYPPEPFSPVYERARELGLRTTAHAGEAAGPESVWGSIRALGVDRIGHGTRAIEDPALVDHLAEHAIPIELCVLSNVRTGVVGSVAAHPARVYFERGIPIVLNTDDPKLFHNTLAEEFAALHAEQAFTLADLHRVAEAAVHVSWLPAERKSQLVARVRAAGAAIDGDRS
jgi:adenosine deaminase